MHTSALDPGETRIPGIGFPELDYTWRDSLIVFRGEMQQISRKN